MNERQLSAESGHLIGARAAGFLGGGLIVGIFLLTIFARVDRERVGTLEQFSETTAVGDNVHYSLPDPLPDPPISAAHLNGETLVPLTYTKVELRDTRMQAVARDPDTRLTIYASRDPLPPVTGESTNEKFYFIKTASNEYLRLRATP